MGGRVGVPAATQGVRLQQLLTPALPPACPPLCPRSYICDMPLRVGQGLLFGAIL